MTVLQFSVAFSMNIRGKLHETLIARFGSHPAKRNFKVKSLQVKSNKAYYATDVECHAKYALPCTTAGFFPMLQHCTRKKQC